MSLCPKCNRPLPDDTTICDGCGTIIKWGGVPPPPVTPTPVAPVPTQTEAPMNVLALVGFISSFFFGIIGLILSAIGYNQIKKSSSKQKGENLALAGMIIGGVWAVWWFFAVLPRF